jgi:hypothetical protein
MNQGGWCTGPRTTADFGECGLDGLGWRMLRFSVATDSNSLRFSVFFQVKSFWKRKKAALPPLPERRFDPLLIGGIVFKSDVLKSEMHFLLKYIRWQMDHPILNWLHYLPNP